MLVSVTTGTWVTEHFAARTSHNLSNKRIIGPRKGGENRVGPALTYGRRIGDTKCIFLISKVD